VLLGVPASNSWSLPGQARGASQAPAYYPAPTPGWNPPVAGPGFGQPAYGSPPPYGPPPAYGGPPAQPIQGSPGSGVLEAIKALFAGIAAAFARAFRVLQLGDWRATAARYRLQVDLDNVWNFTQEVKGYSRSGTVGPSLPGMGGQVHELQRHLVRLGYLSYATGQFDAATAEAVILFKRMRGLHQSYKAADGNWAVNEYATPDVQRAAADLATRPFVVTYQMQSAAQKVQKSLDNLVRNFKYVKPVMKWLGMSNPDPDRAESFFKESRVAMEALGKGEQPGNVTQSTAEWGNTLGLYATAAFGVLQLARTSANVFGLGGEETVKALDDSLVDLGAVSQASQVFAYAAQTAQ